jgi:hypothetical protein
MKKIKYLFCLAVVSLLTIISAQAQNQSGVDSTGLPGDNFSLQGALQLFQDAASPEAFEEAINKEGNHVNNLDLDEDGNTDYVQVVSKMDKDAHVFILQVAVSEKETQDIAVIELEKTGNSTAVIQIIGDEDIYGEQVIVEPDGDGAASIDFINNGNLSGPNVDFENSYGESGLIINVWLWPSVRFVYAPAYHPWVSPWRWNYHPAWWKPWKPYRWNVWHPYRVHHHRPFVVVHTHRGVHARNIYSPYRSSSSLVRTRHSASVNNYRVTRTRTTVTGARGNTTTVKKTTVTGPRGNKATKVRVRRR